MSTRQHIADEPLVAGHIDNTGASAVRQSKVGEAEVDRNSPLLLLLQPVSLLAGKSTDQCSLAVINMAGSADNRMSHLRRHFTKTRSHSVPGSLVAGDQKPHSSCTHVADSLARLRFTTPGAPTSNGGEGKQG